MRHLRKRINGLALGIVILCSAAALRAQIVSEALSTFPEQTESLEYDNLAALRMLPNFDALQQQFSGKPLEHAKSALGRLGIEEDQVSEMVVGSSKGVMYGLLAGAFSGSAAAKVAAKKSIRALKLEDQPMFCPGGGVCLVFLEDWLVAFGPTDQLAAMLQARQGMAASLSADHTVTAMMNATDAGAPVRGIAPGTLFNAFISDGMRSRLGVAVDLSQVSAGINLLSYSISPERVAHVKAALDCKSAVFAVVLEQGLAAFARLQSAASTGKKVASTSFQIMEVSLTGNTVSLTMDTELLKR